MLATLIPMYGPDKDVHGYSLFVQKENKLLTPLAEASTAFDGDINIKGLEIVNNVGFENLSGDRDLFLELTRFSLFSNVENECNTPPSSTVFLIGTTVEPNENNVNRIKDLKSKGYRFALKKINSKQFSEYQPILAQMDYVFLNHNRIRIDAVESILQKQYPNMKFVAVSIDSQEDFDKVSKEGVFSFFEGEYFRIPVKHSGEELAPMKINYLDLIKLVNLPDFDLTTVADVIGRDTALVIRLLEMANRYSANSDIKSIRQATAMIGQKELKKWINSAITKELCSDRPNEITRISLIRARFAENLAPLFGMPMQDNELFLMGLFSVLDIILDKPMADALSMVLVSKQVQDALLFKQGPLSPVYTFILEYENASWHEVSRRIIVDDLNIDYVYHAYVDALVWFKEMFAPTNSPA